MPPWITSLVELLALLSVVPVLATLRVVLRGTTLTTAWTWLAAALAGAIISAATPFLLDASAIGLSDQLWYGTGILLLCPPIAVLGAKRPMSRVWSVFILLPLILVFGWPAASAWSAGWRNAAWVLEEPVFVGYALVLVMGAGNYIGTRGTVSSILYAIAALLIVAPLCPPLASRLPSATLCRLSATVCLAVAASFGAWRRPSARQSSQPATSSGFKFDEVWRDFRNTFGIVWSRRIQDRFNELSRSSNWGVQLTPQGFVGPVEPAVPPNQRAPDTLVAAEAALRWLLRRFVDPAWIDRKCTLK